jgi:excinuclease ABC subunit A
MVKGRDVMKSFVCFSKCDLPVTNDLAKIIVHGAREHNLKNVCFEIPKGKLVALTGPSGSGKSSIANEVLQKECLRQYLEALGMTTDHLSKAKVDTIMGLSPSIGVSQRVTDVNPRSTVGTRTGILTILRNLFASVGRRPCVGCGKIIKQPLQDKSKLTTVEVEECSSKKKKTKSYFACPNCGLQLESLKMAHFSFNAIAGACEACKGIGETIGVDIPRLLNEAKTIKNGGVGIWDEAVAKYYEGVIQAAAKHYDFPFDTNLALRDYTKEQRDFLLYGTAFPDFVKAHKNIKEPKKVSEGKFEGIAPYLLARYKSNPHKLPDAIKKYISHEPCLACHNARLGKIGREVTVCGTTIIDVAEINLRELLQWINALEPQVSEDESQALAALSGAIKERLSNLIEVGLDYLTLDRTLPSLSAGESQRLKLASVVGSGLTGVLYVLDEPTTGLHPHDTAKLLKILRKIQEAGNTVLIIEHDPDVIKTVDYILDVGPGGGSKGGEIVVAGTPAEVMACRASITGKYLARIATVPPNRPRPHENKVLTIRGAAEHNLKRIDVSIPIAQLVVMTGVSGSGKSTFLFGILDKIARQYFNGASEVPGKYVSVHGLNHFNRVVTVDQVTIRNTQSSRSNVATYTKLFDLIRDLFASTPGAKARGFGADKFSFNTSDQRCENCNGAGVVAIDMAFMPDVEMECPVCNGLRFNEELLSVKFQGHHITDILDMTVNDAIAVFSEHQNILGLLDLMKQVGLDYLTLGQSTSTLSGGEAQRIKLAAELSKSGKESTLYLLDEPTTGLHPREVEKLLDILRKLVSKGNTVVVIEHNLDAICEADTIIDFGPGGGAAGGEIVAMGTPEEVAANKDSLTGQCLKAYFGF